MKKTLRKILTFVLVLVVTLSFTSTVYAEGDIMPLSGRETWYAGGGKVGSFTLEGGNVTPVKTMGDSGKLRIYGFADAENNGNPWWIRIQIEDYNTGKILAEGTTGSKTSSQQVYSISFDVTKGQQFRIYMYYETQPVNDAYVSIYYLLS